MNLAPFRIAKYPVTVAQYLVFVEDEMAMPNREPADWEVQLAHPDWPAEGVWDLIGNVLEWTTSKWSKGSASYVWRGGSFYGGRLNAR